MGWRIEPTEYQLNFEDPRLNGLEVRVRSVSIGKFMDLTGMSASQVLGGVTLKSGAIPADPLLAGLADSIIEWNLQDAAGEDVKPSAEALADQEVWVVRALTRAWMEAVSGVSSDLGKGSGSGGTSLEQSIPMEQP